MFLTSLKYNFRNAIRQKDLIIWLLIFPIVLGAFFKIAFSSINENESKFKSIPVAVVHADKNSTLKSVLDNIENSDDPLLKPRYENEKKALELLESKDVTGIIYADDLSLTVGDEGISPTILKSFLSQYKTNEKVITDTAKNDPTKLQAVISKLNEDVSCNETLSLTDSDLDVYTQYFYNLVAMVALMGTMSGVFTAIEQQGNLSDLGARRCCSPQNKFLAITADLMAKFAVQAICVIVSVSYVQFILKVDFGSRLPLVYVSGIIGGIMGVSMGFFIGAIGKMSAGAKNAISLTLSLTSCFFSGLMVGNMKVVMKNALPWFNKINPATVIADSFYSLQVYSDHKVFITKIITMLIITVIFIFGGFLLTRRRKYASL